MSWLIHRHSVIDVFHQCQFKQVYAPEITAPLTHFLNEVLVLGDDKAVVKLGSAMCLQELLKGILRQLLTIGEGLAEKINVAIDQ